MYQLTVSGDNEIPRLASMKSKSDAMVQKGFAMMMIRMMMFKLTHLNLSCVLSHSHSTQCLPLIAETHRVNIKYDRWLRINSITHNILTASVINSDKAPDSLSRISYTYSSTAFFESARSFSILSCIIILPFNNNVNNVDVPSRWQIHWIDH